MSESINNTVTPSTSTSFVDCDETNIKLEIKEEETICEDPLSIRMEAENAEETIKQEIEDESQDNDPFLENILDIMKHKFI